MDKQIENFLILFAGVGSANEDRHACQKLHPIFSRITEYLYNNETLIISCPACVKKSHRGSIFNIIQSLFPMAFFEPTPELRSAKNIF